MNPRYREKNPRLGWLLAILAFLTFIGGLALEVWFAHIRYIGWGCLELFPALGIAISLTVESLKSFDGLYTLYED